MSPCARFVCAFSGKHFRRLIEFVRDGACAGQRLSHTINHLLITVMRFSAAAPSTSREGQRQRPRAPAVTSIEEEVETGLSIRWGGYGDGSSTGRYIHETPAQDPGTASGAYRNGARLRRQLEKVNADCRRPYRASLHDIASAGSRSEIGVEAASTGQSSGGRVALRADDGEASDWYCSPRVAALSWPNGAYRIIHHKENINLSTNTSARDLIVFGSSFYDVPCHQATACVRPCHSASVMPRRSVLQSSSADELVHTP